MLKFFRIIGLTFLEAWLIANALRRAVCSLFLPKDHWLVRKKPDPEPLGADDFLYSSRRRDR